MIDTIPDWMPRARHLRALGLTDKKIAEKLGVTPMRVWHALAAREDAICEGCGQPFSRREGRQSRFCSPQCNGVAQRGKPKIPEESRAAMSAARQGADNPNFKHGGRAGKRSRAGERRFRDEDVRTCRAPGCTSRAVHQHHVVYRQHVRRAGGDEWAPENALALCARCHHSHHARGWVLPVSALRVENIRFAAETLGGDAAEEYLRRYYRDDVGARWWTAFAAGVWWVDDGEAVVR